MTLEQYEREQAEKRKALIQNTNATAARKVSCRFASGACPPWAPSRPQPSPALPI